MATIVNSREVALQGTAPRTLANYSGVHIYTTAPLLYKDSVDSATSGTFSAVTITGKKDTVSGPVDYGWIKLTPYVNSTPGASTFHYRSYTLAPASSSTNTKWRVELYDNDNVSLGEPPVGTAIADTYDILVSFKGATGTTGASAPIFRITNGASSFIKDTAGILAPATITLSTSATNFTGLTYQWTKGGSNISGATSATYPVPASDFSAATSNVYACNATGIINGVAGQTLSDSTTIVRLDYGSSSPAVILSNENTTFPAPLSLYSGIVFTGGACDVTAYIGTTQLAYAGSGPNTFSITRLATNASVAAGTGSGNVYSLPAPTAMTAETALTTLTVILRDASGTALPTITKIISYSLARTGATGTTGTTGNSARVAFIVTASATLPASPTPNTGDLAPVGWSFTAPTVALTAGEYMYQVDGILATGGNITWGNPYLSNLKVGSLSALAVDTGNLTVSTTGSIKNVGGSYGGSGFFLGYDTGSYKFSVGNGTNNLTFNGTTLSVPAATITGTLTASKIAVYDYQGAVADGNFQSGTLTTWDSIPTGWTLVANTDAYTGTGPTASVLKAAATATNSGPYGSESWFDAKEGDTFLLRCKAIRDLGTYTAGTVSLILSRKMADGTVAAHSNTTINPTNVWASYEAITAALPANTIGVRFRIFRATHTNTSNIWFTNFECKKRNAGELVVDGTITTTKLAANAVTTDKLTAGAVTASKLVLTDASNMFPDYNMEDTSFYSSSTGTSYSLLGTTSDHLGRRYINIAGLGVGSVETGWFTITPGEYLLEASASLATNTVGSGTCTVEVEVGTVASDGVITAVSPRVVVASRTDNTSLIRLTSSILITGSQRRIRFIASRTAGSAAARVGGFIIRRKASAELIVDGSITANKLTVTSRGTAINDDPAIEDLSAWAPNTATITIGTALSSVTGKIGPNYFTSSTGASNGMVYSRAIIIDPTKTYYLSANLYAATGNDRNMYIFVEMYDSTGTQIPSSAVTPVWGGSLSGYVFGDLPAIGQFTRYGGQFGAGTVRPIASNTRTIKIGVWFQYASAGSSSVLQAAQDIRLERVNDGNLVVDGAITASKLNVTNLADIASANIGDGGYIKSGQVGYHDGVGWWLGMVGTAPKFSIGDPNGSYMKWDPTNGLVLKTSTANVTVTGVVSNLGNLYSVSSADATIAYSGIRFNSDGSISKRTGSTTYADSGKDWYLENVANIGNNYKIRVLLTSGTLAGGSSTTGNWIAISSAPKFEIQRSTDGTTIVTADIAIAASSDTTVILATGRLNFTAERFTSSGGGSGQIEP